MLYFLLGLLIGLVIPLFGIIPKYIQEKLIKSYAIRTIGSLGCTMGIAIANEYERFHIYTIIDDIYPEGVAAIISQEETLAKRLTRINFIFHIREAQGRKVEEVVPIGVKFIHKNRIVLGR